MLSTLPIANSSSAPDASPPSPEELARRLEEFDRTREPGSLWPGLTEPARVAAAQELERITRLRLAGASAIQLDPARAHSPYALLVAGHTTGIGPVIGAWVERGFVAGTAERTAPFLRHLAHSRARGGRMEREVLPAIDALLQRGVTPVLLKGFHTSRVYFPEPGARRMADVDVLIPPDRVADVEQALSELGFRPDTAALRPYKRDWIDASIDPRHHSLELAHEASRWVLEVHASLDRLHHPGAVARLDSARSSVEPLDVAGRTVHVLSPELLLVYLACHCSQELDGIRLLRLFEIVQVVRHERAHHRLEWDAVLAMLERHRAAHFAYPAFALAEDLAPGTVDPRVLGAGRRASTLAARHTVPRLAPAGGSLDARGVMRQLMWTRGTVAIAQRLLRNVWPASFTKPRDVIPAWRVRLRRLRRGALSLGAPDERPRS